MFPVEIFLISVSPRNHAESAALVIDERLLDLFAGVHHERTVLHHRFVDGLAAQDQELGFRARRDLDDVAVVVLRPEQAPAAECRYAST